MKNIKTIMLLAICLGTSTLLPAQQQQKTQPVQTEVVKEIKTPPAADAIPADVKAGKLQVLPLPAASPNSKLTADQIKTANGSTEKPVMAVAPATEQKTAKSKPVAIEAPVQQQ